MTSLDMQMQFWRLSAEWWGRMANMQIVVLRKMSNASGVWLGTAREATKETRAIMAEQADRERQEISHAVVAAGANAVEAAERAMERAAEHADAAAMESAEASAAAMVKPGEDAKPAKDRETADDVSDQKEKMPDDPLDAAAKAAAGMPSGSGTGQTKRQPGPKKKVDRNRGKQ